HHRSMVQYRCLRVSGAGNLRQRGQEHSGWTGVSELQRVAGKEHGVDGGRKPAIPGGNLQLLQSSKLQPAGQLPPLPDVRPHHLSTRPTLHSVWIEVTFLGHGGFAWNKTAASEWLRYVCRSDRHATLGDRKASFAAAQGAGLTRGRCSLPQTCLDEAKQFLLFILWQQFHS